MKFTVEACVNSVHWYRLQKDSTWRKLSGEIGLLGNDRLFWELQHTSPFLFYTGELVLEEKVYRANPSGITIPETEPTASLSARVHRELKPRKFSLEEMRKVVRRGDNNVHNSLVLDLDGFFKLMDQKQAKSKIGGAAVRYEAFSAGGNFVGYDADLSYLPSVYLSMLEGWASHLSTGSLSMYVGDLPSNREEKELWDCVDLVTKNLK